jgi:drug/metabolite transporter (DMT)-like permease
MLTGTLFALAAGLMWGLVFVGPLMLPDYPALLQSFGRYLAFGLIALPLAWLDRRRLREFSRADWWAALELAAVGNLIYYAFLASAIQRAGAPLPTMIIGTLPVVIALSSNLRDARRDGRLPWLRLLPSLALIASGIALVNQVELGDLRAARAASVAGPDLGAYLLGAVLAVGAVICWTWYPLRNADWLRAHPDRNPRTWATAQGIATLPLALLGYAAFWLWQARQPDVGALVSTAQAVSAAASGASVGAAALAGHFEMPFGPRPLFFVGLMFAIGLFASWLGTLCWNEASQRLPTSLVGQLIVFETLSALSYAYVLRGRWPGLLTLAGIALLVVGVMLALRVRPEPLAVQDHSA